MEVWDRKASDYPGLEEGTVFVDFCDSLEEAFAPLAGDIIRDKEHFEGELHETLDKEVVHIRVPRGFHITTHM
jgi:hypothetical protein